MSTLGVPQPPRIDDAFRPSTPAVPSVASFAAPGAGVSPIIDPNIGQVASVGLPGLQNLDNPVFNIQTGGEGFKQIGDKLSDEMTDSLQEVAEANLARAREKLFSKVFCYPESLLNINNKTFVDGHDAPRHALRISILEYYGANLMTNDEKQNVSDAFTKLASGKFSDALSDVKNVATAVTDRVGKGNLIKSEVELIQQQADIGDIDAGAINEAVNPNFLDGRREQFRTAVNNRLNSPEGRDIAVNYLTTNQSNNFMLRSSRLATVNGADTSVNLRMLPDNINAIIYLYATGTNLNYSYNTNWSQIELQRGITQLMDVLSTANLDNIGPSLKKAAEAMGAGLFNAIIDNPTIKATISAKLGIAPATNYEFLFDSVKRRSFGVSVKFVPKSENEVRNVAKIISALKYYSHPERPNGAYYFRAPSVFLLENLTYVEGKQWVTNLYLPRYKVAALQSINVKYDQNGSLVTHEELLSTVASVGGSYKSPIKIEMELAFDELNLLTRSDMVHPDRFFNANKKSDGFY